MQKEARTSVLMTDSCSILEITIKPSFNEAGDVVLPKSKTSYVRISYPPNVTQKESFFYLNKFRCSLLFLKLGFLKTHQTFDQKLT